MKKLSVILATLTTLFAIALTGCSSVESEQSTSEPTGAAARTIEQIKESGEIVLGVFSDKAPFGYVDTNGEYSGYDIELGNKIGEDLGVKVKYVPVEAASRVEFLESGKVDVILANFTVTPERAEKVDYAKPYMKVSLGLASSKDNPITEIDQIKNKKIVIVKGTTADTWLQANYPELNVQKFEQYTEVTSALTDGRADAWITDNTEALAWTRQNDKFVTSITSFGDPDTIAPAVQKSNTSVLDWLNTEVENLSKQGFFLDAYANTLQPVYGDDVSPEEIVVK